MTKLVSGVYDSLKINSITETPCINLCGTVTSITRRQDMGYGFCRRYSNLYKTQDNKCSLLAHFCQLAVAWNFRVKTLKLKAPLLKHSHLMLRYNTI